MGSNASVVPGVEAEMGRLRGAAGDTSGRRLLRKADLPTLAAPSKKTSRPSLCVMRARAAA
jgi:hypothetical protein